MLRKLTGGHACGSGLPTAASPLPLPPLPGQAEGNGWGFPTSAEFCRGSGDVHRTTAWPQHYLSVGQVLYSPSECSSAEKGKTVPPIHRAAEKAKRINSYELTKRIKSTCDRGPAQRTGGKWELSHCPAVTSCPTPVPRASEDVRLGWPASVCRNPHPRAAPSCTRGQSGPVTWLPVGGGCVLWLSPQLPGHISLPAPVTPASIPVSAADHATQLRA